MSKCQTTGGSEVGMLTGGSPSTLYGRYFNEIDAFLETGGWLFKNGTVMTVGSKQGTARVREVERVCELASYGTRR